MGLIMDWSVFSFIVLVSLFADVYFAMCIFMKGPYDYFYIEYAISILPKNWPCNGSNEHALEFETLVLWWAHWFFFTSK